MRKDIMQIRRNVRSRRHPTPAERARPAWSLRTTVVTPAAVTAAVGVSVAVRRDGGEGDGKGDDDAFSR